MGQATVECIVLAIACLKKLIYLKIKRIAKPRTKCRREGLFLAEKCMLDTKTANDGLLLMCKRNVF